MKKKKINLREVIDLYHSNCARIAEIRDLCESEQRKRNEKEDEEFAALERDNQMCEMTIRAAAADNMQNNPNAVADAETMLRERIKANQKTEIILVRDAMVVSDMTDTGTIPLNVKDILEPLEEGMILHQVGLPFLTGLTGDYVWPVYEMVEATVLEEAAELSDTKIPFSKLSARPARCGIKVPVTSQSLTQTDGILETVVRKVMPHSIVRLLNKIIFGRTAVNTVADEAGLVGPFKEAMNRKVKLSHTPTFRELNGMKARVLATGIDGEHMCYTMTKGMQAILEGEPVNPNGVYVPMVQNGKLCGLPIYTSEEMCDKEVVYKKASVSGGNVTWNDYTKQEGDTITYEVSGSTAEEALAQIDKPTNNKIAKVSVVTEYIGLGDWRYQPMGLFGRAIRFIVDPYTKAGSDIIEFVLNCDYGTKTLRPEAFLIGEVSAGANA